jgi:ubiquinone/menaquinone biosynthesis C-methylase UbiE
MKTEQFIAEQYSRGDSLNGYIEITKKGLWKEEVDLFEKYITENAIVLDLGCGTGRVALNIKQGKEIYACDLVPAMIKTAEDILDLFRNKPQFSIQDAKSLTYDDSFFDVVIFAYNGINTVPGRENRASIVREVDRILKPGGIFIFATHIRNFRGAPIKWLRRYIVTLLRLSPYMREIGDNVYKNYGRKQYINIPTVKDTESLFKGTHMKKIDETPTEIAKNNSVNSAPPNTFMFVYEKY